MPDLSRILHAERSLNLTRVVRGSQPLVMADLARASKGRAVFIAADDAAMRSVSEAAEYFAPEAEIIEFPAWDSLPYDRASPALSISAQRLSALHRLQQGKPANQLVVTTVNAVLQRVLTPFRIRESIREFRPGMEIGRESLAALLRKQGYTRVDSVVDAGDYAVRGSIVDIFPSGLGSGLRLDFFGDELESMRLFDPGTQLTVGSVDRHLLLPASEALLDDDSIRRFRGRYREKFGATATQDPLYEAVSDGRRLAGMEHWLPLFEEKLATLFDHLGADDVIAIDQAGVQVAKDRLSDIADFRQARTDTAGQKAGSYRPLETNELYLPSDEFEAAMERVPIHRTVIFEQPENDNAVDFGFSSARDFAAERGRGENVYEAAAKHFQSLKKDKKRPMLAAYSEGSRSRIASILEEAGTKVQRVATWQEALAASAKGTLAAMVLALETGFANDELEVVTEQDILGDRLVRRRKRKKDSDAFLAELAALNPGDLVVHMDHGIGKYLGLEPIPVGKSKHDCVALEYKGGDKLYIPVENIDVLSRYGSSEDAMALDRLGGEAWQRRRSQLKERIRAIAGELMQTAAARALRKAPVIEPDDASYNQFVDKFPWEETDDQDRAISDVLRDLERGRPMDRLVCGDVGFGKTEVALRAAFVTAMEGRQVAIVAPTTLLARQHYQNFIERFGGFPLKIGRLSRLVSAREMKETREGLAKGDIDIVIGTHAILSKSTRFKDLALVVVDEEQRFGVSHKEKLKQLRADVHMLTLTATPIPRTLQMAMTGLRELSTIQTPPVDRLAVRTYVSEWDDVVMREALMREHHRGGQSFIVVPRISDMAEIEDWLKAHVPELKAITAHGQMSPTEVEDRMGAFYEGKFEILLSTTIVESGLDIPSANTIIIHRADRFGLAQLYQLRGRVGRAKLRAYAYMTYEKDTQLSEVAEKRLKVLADLDSLGAGFQLASRDLDIRGAGNLLGDEQSGHIREVGFELYQSMLEDAILAAKAGDAGLEKDTTAFSPQITVDAPIMIPEDYVPDLAVRMALYRRLNQVADKAEIESLAGEMIDRFGPLPDATENLVRLIEVKQQAIEAHIAKIDVGAQGTLVTFHEDKFPNPEGLIAYVERLKGTAQLRPDMKLVIKRAWGDPKSRLNGLVQLTKGLAGIAAKAKPRAEKQREAA